MDKEPFSDIKRENADRAEMRIWNSIIVILILLLVCLSFLLFTVPK